MNRGLLTGVKNGLFVPDFYGGGDPARDGQSLIADSTQAGGVRLYGAAALPVGRFKDNASQTNIHSPGLIIYGNQVQFAEAANQHTFIPYIVNTRETWDQIVCEVVTAQAASHGRFALYAASTDWVPVGGPLVDSGLVDTSTTGVKATAITPLAVAPGLYLMAKNFDTAGIVMRGFNTANNMMGMSNGMGGNTITGYLATLSQTFATFPPNPVTTVIGYNGVGSTFSVFIRKSVC